MDAQYPSTRSRSAGSTRSSDSTSGSGGSSCTSGGYLSIESPSSNSYTQPSTAATTPETDFKSKGQSSKSFFPLAVNIPASTLNVAAEIQKGVDQTLANMEFDEFNQNRAHHEQMTREGHPFQMRQQPQRSTQMLATADQDAAVKSTLAGTNDALTETLRSELLRAQHDILTGMDQDNLDVMDAVIDFNNQFLPYGSSTGTPPCRSPYTPSTPQASHGSSSTLSSYPYRSSASQTAPIAYRTKADPRHVNSLMQVRAVSDRLPTSPG